jgi:hypothetical protein
MRRRTVSIPHQPLDAAGAHDQRTGRLCAGDSLHMRNRAAAENYDSRPTPPTRGSTGPAPLTYPWNGPQTDTPNGEADGSSHLAALMSDIVD